MIDYIIFATPHRATINRLMTTLYITKIAEKKERKRSASFLFWFRYVHLDDESHPQDFVPPFFFSRVPFRALDVHRTTSIQTTPDRNTWTSKCKRYPYPTNKLGWENVYPLGSFFRFDSKWTFPVAWCCTLACNGVNYQWWCSQSSRMIPCGSAMIDVFP